jgi:hypothetical protein
VTLTYSLALQDLGPSLANNAVGRWVLHSEPGRLQQIWNNTVSELNLRLLTPYGSVPSSKANSRAAGQDIPHRLLLDTKFLTNGMWTEYRKSKPIVRLVCVILRAKKRKIL